MPREHRTPLALGIIVILLAAGVVGGVIANAINSPSSKTTTVSATGSAPSTAPAPAATCNVTNVAKDELPSVVTILAGSGESSGVGSGEVIRSDGYILTNNHVITPAVPGGALEVQFNDGTSASATIVGATHPPTWR